MVWQLLPPGNCQELSHRAGLQPEPHAAHTSLAAAAWGVGWWEVPLDLTGAHRWALGWDSPGCSAFSLPPGPQVFV